MISQALLRGQRAWDIPSKFGTVKSTSSFGTKGTEYTFDRELNKGKSISQHRFVRSFGKMEGYVDCAIQLSHLEFTLQCSRTET